MSLAHLTWYLGVSKDVVSICNKLFEWGDDDETDETLDRKGYGYPLVNYHNYGESPFVYG